MPIPESSRKTEPTRPLQPEMLAALQRTKHGLTYLTPNDWSLLTDKARIVVLTKGERLLQRGQQTRQVYLLIEGIARVEKSPGTEIARIGPGEICGEMAFLERSSASASVIADEEVRAYVLDWPVMEELFELYPHLGSRFYRSLAVSLSRRLRGLIGGTR
jgi:CRP-like cAMP-binding protein